MKKGWTVLLSAAILFGSGMMAVAESETYASIDAALAAAPYAENELLVKTDASLYMAAPYALSSRAVPTVAPESEKVLFEMENGGAARVYSAGKMSWRLLRYPEGTDLREVMRSLSEDPHVVGVTPNYLVEEPKTFDSSPAGETAGENPWYLSRLGVTQAREFLKMKGVDPYGDPDVIVACVDAGIDVTHPALRDSLWVNPGEGEAPDQKDNDGNGYVDDIHGYNFNDGNGDVTDAVMDANTGHGTGTAGVIVANPNIEGSKMEGIAPNVKIMACKVFGRRANTVSQVTEAVIYAARNGADVINLSLGIPIQNASSATVYHGSSDINALEDAVNEVQERSIVVASAGNSSGYNESGSPNEPAPPGWTTTTQIYPAIYPNVVGVMAEQKNEDSGGYLAFFSMWDVKPDNAVEYEVMAPGSQILTTKMATSDRPDDWYAVQSGTSFSAPLVSGIFALMRTLYPDKEAYPNSALIRQFLDSCDYKLGKSYLGVNDETVRINYRSANAFRALTGGEAAVHPAQITAQEDGYRITQTVSNPNAPMKARLLVAAYGENGVCEAVYGSTEERATEYSNFTFTCTVPKDERFKTLRVMLWGSLNGLDPLTDVAEFSCESVPAP